MFLPFLIYDNFEIFRCFNLFILEIIRELVMLYYLSPNGSFQEMVPKVLKQEYSLWSVLSRLF